MQNRKLVCILLLVIDVIAGVLILLWKHGMDALGILSIVAGFLGSAQIYFSYVLAKNGLKTRAKIEYKDRVEEDCAPSRFLVLSNRISGWIICSLPIFFLWLGM